MDARLAQLGIADLNAVTAPFGSERTLPGGAYTSADVFSWELEHIWDAGWVCLGRTDQFVDGTATEVRTGSESLIVTNDASRVSVMYNVCRHRGHEILRHRERRTSLLCPYHGWLYRLDGSLRAAPKMGHRFDLGDVTLGEVRSASWHGWLFATVGDDTPDIGDYLGGLGAEVAPYDPESLVVGHSTSYEVAANWKLIHENYHECYHCTSIHPQLVEVSNPDSGHNRTPDGAWVGGTLEFRSGVETMSMDGTSPGQMIVGEEHRGVALYVGVIPNLLISLHPDYVLTHRLEPGGPDATTVHCEWLFPRSFAGSESFDPGYAVGFWDLTNRQDWEACESLQRGASSRGYKPGTLGEGEDGVYQFLVMMARAYLGEGISPVDNPVRDA